MVGNDFDANVMGRIFARLLPAVGLVKKPINDKWGNASEAADETRV